MDIIEFIDLMKKVDLAKLSYNKILSVIRDNEIQLPYLTAMIKKGAPIERGRIHKDNELFFTSEFDISYRTDVGNIDKFNRASKPHTSRFYGALPGQDVQMARIVLFSELDEKFRNNERSDYSSKMTIGRWIVQEDFEVADIVFSDSFKNSQHIRDKYNFWVEKLKGHKIGEENYQKLLKFFSDEFAKQKIITHHDYKLSTAYADMAIYANDFNGVLYPSVRTDYMGINIVLTDRAVEKYLKLEKVCVFKYIVENNRSMLIPEMYSDDLGPLNTRFNWNPIKA
jgi:hypothetical protein